MSELMTSTAEMPVFWRRHSFGEPIRTLMPAGMTIAEIIRSLPEIPRRFWRDGEVMISDQPVPRAMWERVRPKVKSNGQVDVSLWLAPQDDALGILKIVATIAIIVGAALISGGALGPLLGGAFAAGEFGATVAAGTFAVGASLALTLAVTALSPPPTLAVDGSSAAADRNTAALSANVLGLGAPAPHVRGIRKIYPPLVCKTLIELVGDDEYVTGVLGLAGSHQLSNIRAAGVPVDSLTELEYETREGFAADALLTLVTRQSKTDAAQLELSEHALNQDVDDADPIIALVDQVAPLNSVPVWHRMRALGSPDEIWLNILWPQGLFDVDTPATPIAVPVRMRIREVGDTDWIYLPEVFVAYRKQETFSKDIRLMWRTAPVLPTPPQRNGPIVAYGAVAMRVEEDYAFCGGGSVSIAPFTAFDGARDTTIVPMESNATQVYIGGDFKAWPRTVEEAVVWPSSSAGFWSAGTSTTITLNLYGKNGTAPASGTDGTLLGTSGAIADTTGGVVITSGDVTTEYRYLWVHFILNGTATVIRVSEIQFIAANDWSHLAHSYFRTSLIGGAAAQYVDATTLGSTNLRNIGLYQDRVEVYLDPGTFPKGNYEIDIKRGTAMNMDEFTVARYSRPGVDDSTSDMFRWNDRDDGASLEVPISMRGIYHKMVRQRMSLIWNEHPLPNAPGNLALIAFKVKNRQIGDISVDAGKYVYDYDSGSGAWDDLVATSNPAPHLRDVWAGELNSDPVPDDLIDDDVLISWRTHCIDKGYDINAVIEGPSADVVAQLIAGCGYARVRQSEIFGVIMDRDRSAESPVQTFTARNARGYSWEKAYPRLPSGFRCIYYDVDNDYRETELIVMDPEGDGGGRFEEMRYDGFITAAEVTARALFDLGQGRKRMTFHKWESNAQAIKCKRGDLVGFNHPAIDDVLGSAYVREIVLSGDDVIGLRLDGTVPIDGNDGFFSGPDDFISDLYGDGLWGPMAVGAVVRLKDGETLTGAIVADPDATDGSRELTFVTPVTGPVDGLDLDCLVSVGPLGEERKRFIVGDITPKTGDNFPHAFTAVEEAPELWAA